MANTKRNKTKRIRKSKDFYKKNWLRNMLYGISFTDPQSLAVFEKEQLNLEKNFSQAVGLALSTILKQMKSCIQNPDDRLWTGKYRLLLRAIKKEPLELTEKSLKPFPSASLLYRELPKSLKFLRDFHKERKPEIYHKAVKEGLFRELCYIAEALLTTSDRYPNETLLLREFVSLMVYALRPIIDWSHQILFGSENKELSDKARKNLQKTGEQLTSVSQVGRRRKMPLKTSEFSFFHSVMICVLYGLLHHEFKEAKEHKELAKKIVLFEQKLAGKMSSKEDLQYLFNEEPHSAAKKVLCNYFNIGERTLNSILSQKESLAANLD